MTKWKMKTTTVEMAFQAQTFIIQETKYISWSNGEYKEI